MPAENVSPPSPDVIEVDLRNNGFAAFLAWLWPGAGHIYQRRYGKGVLFMVCIMGTYCFGLSLGHGHVVHAAWDWEKDNRRWQYGCQVCVGIPAFPAIIQRMRVNSKRPPLFKGVMAPPYPLERREAVLSEWHRKLGNAFELGTLYTVVAGLLNVLAIYDAYAGPFMSVSDREDRPPPDKKKKKAKPGG